MTHSSPTRPCTSLVPAADPKPFPVSPGVAPDTATRLTWVLDLVPPRAPSPEAPPPVTPIAIQPLTAKSARHRVAPVLAPVPAVPPDALELAYEDTAWTPAAAGGLTDASSAEPRVGQECVSTCTARSAADLYKTKTI